MAGVTRAHVRTRRGRWGVLAVAAVVLLVAVVASLAVGSRPVPPAGVWAALTGGDVPAADAAAVVGLRLPRTVLGLLVGAALAVAGAVIQSLTRNPLADPGILGVTAGSGFAVAMSIAVLGVSTPAGYVWFALGGAFLATVAVYLVGTLGRARVDVAQMLLGGMALTAVLAGIVSAIRLTDPEDFSALLVWEAGSFQARGWDVIVPVLPFALVGLAAAPLLGPALNALALGDDVASSLGTPVVATRLGCVAVIAVLAGSATALAGPIAFVGLMIPHAARWVTGPDQRWVLGLSAVLGPVLLLVSDVVARVILWPGEVPVGIVTAFLGAPVLVVLVRHRRMVGQ
ncbi:iron ABC transporter permease [Isoptericola sp. BMS4]|uniref:FecCD family ABC transporter permease n=1 Tax=Isoptericola sp. BMS4 TaxID=2527875 RepID=UPI0014243F2E|nr:iron chelate uptake ABC transporter family permease subunit [Isoptericola sp. BMS4]